MKKISGIFLTVLTFFSSTLNVFAEAIEVYEEKTQTINKADYDDLKTEVENKVFELNQKDDEYVYDYEISIVSEEDEIVITDTKKITSETKFTSEEEARKFYEEYELEDSWKQGELAITSNEESITINGDTITITCEEETCSKEIATLESALNEYEELEIKSKSTTSKNDKKVIVYSIDGVEQEVPYEEAIKLVATLNPKVEGYKLVKNEFLLVKCGSIETKKFKEIMGEDTYETYEEAKSAADKFLSNTQYKDKVAVIVAVYDETEKTTNKTTLPGATSKEAAYAIALADIQKELINAINNGKITIEGTVEQTKKALEEAYKTGKLQLNGMKLDGRVIYYSLPEYRVNTETKKVTQEFYTETAAQLAKAAIERLAAELENAEAVDGVSSSITNITLTESGNTTSIGQGATVRGNRGTYTLIPTDNNYYSLRKGNKMVIWTKSALDETKKTDISNTLKEQDETLTEVLFITGYNIENNIEGIGTFKFVEESKTLLGQTIKSYKIVVTTDTKCLTVKTGMITSGKKYILSYNKVTKTELWYVDKTEVKYGFDYKVQGGGVKVTPNLYKVQSILVGKIYTHTMAYRVNTIRAYTSYKASFDIYKEELQTKAKVTYKITREKAPTGSTDGEEITPPNTKAEVSFLLDGALLMSILVAVVSLKKLCK